MPKLGDLVTPALIANADDLDHNLRVMAEALPGERLRPHVKAHKTTALARRQAESGHRGFTCATVREVEGMAATGLGDDLLLANEVADATRLARVDARVTLAVDSESTVEAAARAGIKEVLVDVSVGLPRCGIPPEDAGRIADLARARGLSVRGVMGYEGHVVGLEERATRQEMTDQCMALLQRAHELVGGDMVSAGGTGTYDTNQLATEIQAGSYVLMDTTYARLDIPFRQALGVYSTVISVSSSGYAVANAGLKALGMDHGNPEIDGGHTVLYVADEHTVFVPASPVGVGDAVVLRPAHVDPTVAYHAHMHVVRGEEVLETWAVDLRGW
ncbi:MAG: alanine racemase [Candidatus Dormibacteraeota bacterium]|nr:alanine racemase [Candidatus Dormibacteraeota bacterium]